MANRGSEFKFAGYTVAIVAILPLLMHAQPENSSADRIRHFGPLIVVSSRAAVDDPERIARGLLDGKSDERPMALQAMGVDSDPSIHELWISPREGTDATSPAQLAKSWISTAVPDLIYGTGPSPYKVIHVGVDDLGERPFEIESIFKKEADQWFRVATIACLCLSNREGDVEFTPAPKRPKVKELSFRFNTSLGTNSIWSDQIVRFRLKDDVLEPVFDKEGDTWNCPTGIEPGKLCTGMIVDLFSSELIDTSGHKHHGAVLMRSEETIRHLDKEVAPRKPLTCSSYLWDKSEFTYKIVDFKAKACHGIPADK